MEPFPTIFLVLPVVVLIVVWAHRKYTDKQKEEAEWEKNKGKYKFKDWRY